MNHQGVENLTPICIYIGLEVNAADGPILLVSKDPAML
jgi:hypothetical protein